MILKVIMTYDVDETTGEAKYIGKEEVTVDASKPTVKSTAVKAEGPLLTLADNKYNLTPEAAALLNVAPGDSVHINYPKKDGEYVPAIASSSTLGLKAGNKLTKSLSVSFRGAANDRLAEFGSEFKLEPSNKDGVFYLISEKMLMPKTDGAEQIKIDEDFELDDLNDIDLDLDTDSESEEIKLDLTL